MKVGRRGTIVLPAELRKRHKIEEDSMLVAIPTEEGILLRLAGVCSAPMGPVKTGGEASRDDACATLMNSLWLSNPTNSALFSLMAGLPAYYPAGLRVAALATFQLTRDHAAGQPPLTGEVIVSRRLKE